LLKVQASDDAWKRRLTVFTRAGNK